MALDPGAKKVGLAIGVSHLRALAEAQQVVRGKGIAIILEEDVVPTTQATFLVANLLATMARENTQGIQYCALCWGGPNPKHMKEVLGGDLKEIQGTKTYPYMRMFHLPSANNRFQFVGQGARTICYRGELLEHLLDTKMSKWWDLHVPQQPQKMQSWREWN